MAGAVQKVLVVEDDVSLSKTLDARLRTAMDNHPDAMVLDLMLPKKNGADVAKELRKDSWGKDLPIMVLTNLGSEYKMVREAVGGECPLYEIKSGVSLEDILSRVDQLIKEGKSCCCVIEDKGV